MTPTTADEKTDSVSNNGGTRRKFLKALAFLGGAALVSKLVPSALAQTQSHPGSEIEAGTISSTQLASNAVTTAKIANGAVTSAKVDSTVSVIGTHHIFVPALSMYPATTTPCSDHTKSEFATNDVDIYTLDFDQTTAEIAKFDWIPPENWDAGTVKVKIYWTAASGTGGETVEFEVSAIAISNDDAMDAAFGTAVAVTDSLIATNDLHVSPQSAAITIGGTPLDSDWIQFKIKRDTANDTLAADAKLIGLVLEYTVEKPTSIG